MEQKVISPRQLFSVIIHNKEYDVFDINGKEHEGYNDIPKTWWLYHSSKMPEGATPPADSESFVPFSRGVERRLWEIKIKQTNSTKQKWGETRFNSHTSVEMWCNNKLVYAFGTTGGNRGMSFAMAKVQYLQVVLQEHCYNFFETEKEQGRKICWYGLPATVKVKSSTWEIGIIPDYTAGLSKEEWWKELKRRESKHTKESKEDKEMEEEDTRDSERDDYINWGDALSDQHIYWFRK